MLFSPTCRHALRALFYMARQKEAIPILVKGIAQSQNIPQPFLAKILGELKRKGLVTSVRGPGGGYLLARSPEHITISDVVTAVDGETALDTCILGLPECNDASPCPLHEFWKSCRAEYGKTVGDLTLRQAADAIEEIMSRDPR